LQLVNFERQLFNEGFEGLYLPRVLGYSVLRGEINDRVKYIRPQDHFRDIIVTICNSLNFDQLKNRIGQTMQVGFALSSDIWISNLKGLFSNKKIVAFLDTQRLPKYRDAKSVKDFDNSNLVGPIKELVANESLHNADEFLELLMVSGFYYDLDAEGKDQIKSTLDKLRGSESFDQKFFAIYNDLLEEGSGLTVAMDQRMGTNVSRTQSDELSAYFNMMDVIHSKGYVHEDAIDSIRNFYESHEGLSVYNECLRNHIKNYFETFLSNIDEESYQEYFEINKTFIT